MRLPVIVSFLLALLAPSCVTPPPPIEHVGAGGVVRAFDDDEAREVSAHATELTIEVCRVLRVEPQPYVIHAYQDMPELAAGIRVHRDSQGEVVERLIELHAGARSAPRFPIAHELAHWNISGTAWDRLPHAVEEGLCDFVAGLVATEYRVERVLDLKARAARGLDAPLDEILALTSRTWERADGAAKSSAYALGYFLVDHIGLDRLRRVCESSVAPGTADVPIEQLLDAADMDRESLLRALHAWGATADPQPFELRLKLAPPSQGD